MRSAFKDIAISGSERALAHFSGVNTLRLWPTSRYDIKDILRRLCFSVDQAWDVNVVGKVFRTFFPGVRVIVNAADGWVARGGSVVEELLEEVSALSDSRHL